MAVPPDPTDAELAILQVLWRRGPGTVRDVQAALDRGGETGYTTVLKFLQIMTEKGLVTRDTSERAHVYAAAVEEAQVQRRLAGDLLDRVFGGSARRLILGVLSARPAPPEDLAAIRALLDDLERTASDPDDPDPDNPEARP